MPLIPIEHLEATGGDFDDAVAAVPPELLDLLSPGKRHLLLGDLSPNLRRIILRQLAAAHCLRVVTERLSDYQTLNGGLPRIDVIERFVQAIKRGQLEIDKVSVDRLQEVYEAYEVAERFLKLKRVNDELEAERLAVIRLMSSALLQQLDEADQVILNQSHPRNASEQVQHKLRTALGQATKLREVVERSVESLQGALNDFLRDYSHMISGLSIEDQNDLVEFFDSGVTEQNKPTAARIVELLPKFKQDEKEAMAMVPGLESQLEGLKSTFPLGFNNIEEGTWYYQLLLGGDMEASIRRSLAFHQGDPDGNKDINTLKGAAENLAVQLDGTVAKFLRERHDAYTAKAQAGRTAPGGFRKRK